MCICFSSDITDVFISGPLRFVAGMVEGAKGCPCLCQQETIRAAYHTMVGIPMGRAVHIRTLWHLIGLATLNLIMKWAVQLGRDMTAFVWDPGSPKGFVCGIGFTLRSPLPPLNNKFPLYPVQSGMRVVRYLARLAPLITCSLQTPRLPTSDPAYPWTSSNPCVVLAFFYFPKPKTRKKQNPKTLKA